MFVRNDLLNKNFLGQKFFIISHYHEMTQTTTEGFS